LSDPQADQQVANLKRLHTLEGRPRLIPGLTKLAGSPGQNTWTQAEEKKKQLTLPTGCKRYDIGQQLGIQVSRFVGPGTKDPLGRPIFRDLCPRRTCTSGNGSAAAKKAALWWGRPKAGVGDRSSARQRSAPCGGKPGARSSAPRRRCCLSPGRGRKLHGQFFSWQFRKQL